MKRNKKYKIKIELDVIGFVVKELGEWRNIDFNLKNEGTNLYIYTENTDVIDVITETLIGRENKYNIKELNEEYKYYFIDIENAMLPGDSIRIVGIKYFTDDYKAKEYFDEWIKKQSKFSGQYLLLRSI